MISPVQQSFNTIFTKREGEARGKKLEPVERGETGIHYTLWSCHKITIYNSLRAFRNIMAWPQKDMTQCLSITVQKPVHERETVRRKRRNLRGSKDSDAPFLIVSGRMERNLFMPLGVPLPTKTGGPPLRMTQQIAAYSPPLLSRDPRSQLMPLCCAAAANTTANPTIAIAPPRPTLACRPSKECHICSSKLERVPLEW